MIIIGNLERVCNTKIVSTWYHDKIFTNTPADLELVETAGIQSKPKPSSSRLSTTWTATPESNQRKIKIRILNVQVYINFSPN